MIFLYKNSIGKLLNLNLMLHKKEKNLNIIKYTTNIVIYKINGQFAQRGWWRVRTNV